MSPGLDGSVDSKDVSVAKAISLEKIIPGGIRKLFADINQDGSTDSMDTAVVKAVSLQKLSLNWKHPMGIMNNCLCT